VEHALNGIGSLFELQSPTTKNDFCRMFIREGLLDPLSAALLNVMAIRGTTTMETKMKVIRFSHKSRNQIFMLGTLWVQEELSDVSFFFVLYTHMSNLMWVGCCELVNFLSQSVLFRC
jgi:hypothetical protein